MKNKTITLAATILGLSFLASNADAQGWRGFRGWGQVSQGGCNVYDIRSDVNSIDRLSNRMAYQFSREMNYRCSCSVELLKHLKKTTVLTRNLVVASNGSCKCAFKKAACAVNDNMKCVAKQARKVRNLSCSMNSNIEEAGRLARRIHSNADQFTPRTAYTNNRRPAPSYGHGHNHNTNQQDQISSLIFSLFNRR